MGRAAIGDLTVSSSSIVLPNPAGPVLLHWDHDFKKVELLYSNALCTTRAKYIVFIKNPLLYSCVQNEIDGVQLYSCPSSVFVGSRGNGERCLFAESVRLRWVSGFPWCTHIVVGTMYVVLNGLDAKMNLVMYAGVWCTFFSTLWFECSPQCIVLGYSTGAHCIWSI